MDVRIRSLTPNRIRRSAAIPPPPLPPQHISRVGPSLQFPRCCLFPFARPLAALADRGWYGTPLRRHVVVCGFPRSGTTLCQAMIESCVTGVRTFGRERPALEAARYARRDFPIMITKRPLDLFCISKLRRFYTGHPSADVRFVVFCRDPRAVLTSRHVHQPDEYCVSTERWQALHSYWRWISESRPSDTLTVRYEDLVRDPDGIEQRLTKFIGWQVRRPFSRFHTDVPDSFRTDALNGVRPVDPRNISRWRDERYAPRIREVLRQLPELPQWLIEMGYEADDAWTADYR